MLFSLRKSMKMFEVYIDNMMNSRAVTTWLCPLLRSLMQVYVMFNSVRLRDVLNTSKKNCVKITS